MRPVTPTEAILEAAPYVHTHTQAPFQAGEHLGITLPGSFPCPESATDHPSDAPGGPHHGGHSVVGTPTEATPEAILTGLF